jgi:hypothetical protein
MRFLSLSLSLSLSELASSALFIIISRLQRAIFFPTSDRLSNDQGFLFSTIFLNLNKILYLILYNFVRVGWFTSIHKGRKRWDSKVELSFRILPIHNLNEQNLASRIYFLRVLCIHKRNALNLAIGQIVM